MAIQPIRLFGDPVLRKPAIEVVDFDKDLRRLVEERTAELMAGGITWCPGARELLTEVRASGLRTALVTTTPRRVADIVLATIRADLDDDPFDVTICGDEVPARKPDPAPYLQAMAALGVDPEEYFSPGDIVIMDDA